MRRGQTAGRAGVLVTAAAWSLLVAAPARVHATPAQTVGPAQIDRWMEELSNWGRWGEDDQRDALNLITPHKRRQAAALVREGLSISLARIPLMEAAPDNPHPYQQTMRIRGGEDSGGAMDTYRVSYHGLAHTHLDALCHVFYRGRMYNRFSWREVTEEGCARGGIGNLQEGILTRGLLIDIPRLKGIPYLEPGTPVQVEDLEAWEARSGIRVGSGDAVFVRTGRRARRRALGPWDAGAEAAGLHVSVAPWLRERGVALLGGDAANDLMPSGVEGLAYPLHRLALVAMGVHLLDNCDLEELGRGASRLGRWEFLFTAAPLPVSGGTGSPVNPIATF